MLTFRHVSRLNELCIVAMSLIVKLCFHFAIISLSQGEIEGFIRENEELKTKNQSLEAQLKTALDPCSIDTVQTDDMSVDPSVLEEMKNRLRAATDVCDKVKQDMDKLKEVCYL